MPSMHDAGADAQANTTATEKLPTVIRGEMAAQLIKTREMAAAIGISPAALRNRLNGRTPILFTELLRISDVLDFPPHELLAAAQQDRRPRRDSGRIGGSAADPWNLPFAGTPEELDSALWPLGVRLRAPADRSGNDQNGDGRVLGEVVWWPDREELTVTPDPPIQRGRDDQASQTRRAHAAAFRFPVDLPDATAHRDR